MSSTLPAQATPIAESAGSPDVPIPEATPALTVKRFLPLITASPAPAAACAAVPGVSYQALPVLPPPSDRPAEAHADLNLALRGCEATSGFLGLVDYAGATDYAAPQLPYLFADRRTPVFQSVQRVYDWNWANNCPRRPHRCTGCDAGHAAGIARRGHRRP